jgi:hypothetical protein
MLEKLDILTFLSNSTKTTSGTTGGFEGLRGGGVEVVLSNLRNAKVV